MMQMQLFWRNVTFLGAAVLISRSSRAWDAVCASPTDLLVDLRGARVGHDDT